MKELCSIVDGFNVLLGTPTTNIACLVALLFVIRKPPYYTKDSPQPKTADELNHEARILFSFLIIGHFFTAIFRSLQRSNRFKKYVVSSVSIFMAVWGVLDAAIAMNWSFPRAPNSPYLRSIGLWQNDKQFQFEIWMWLEMGILWSYLFGTMWFLFCSFLRAPTSDGFGP